MRYPYSMRSFRYDLCAITVLGEAKTESNLFCSNYISIQTAGTVYVSYSYVQYMSYQTSMKCLFYVACCLSAVQNGCQEAMDIS